MKNFYLLAIKNVTRNLRRSLLTILVTTIGITFLFNIRGFLNGLQKEIKESNTKAEIGDIQVTMKGFRNALPSKSYDYLFQSTEEIRRIILDTPHVTGVTERLFFGGIINHQKSQTTTPFMAIGIDPQGENRVCPRLRDMVKKGNGHFLDSSLEKNLVLDSIDTKDIADAPMDMPVSLAKPLPKNAAKNLKAKVSEFHQVMLGTTMREGFTSMVDNKPEMAAIGDELILMTSDPNGAQHSLQAELTAIIDFPNPTASKTMIYLNLSAAQKLLGSEGKINEIVISLDDTKNRQEVAAILNEKLAAYNLVAEPWDEINKFFANIMSLQNIVFSVVMSVIMIFVIFAIIVTGFMTVSERTREIGTMMAIGYKRKHIIRLFLMESTFLGLAGGITGVLLGSIIVGVMGLNGVPFLIPGTIDKVIIHPFNTIFFIMQTVLFGMLAGVIGSLYPARLASKLSPQDALTHI
ncbi:MAG: FtsX-like permease family protein [Spirochaetia bacterium]|nr:FtsX-like permease family protein [Spirochaetia bacterium]